MPSSNLPDVIISVMADSPASFIGCQNGAMIVPVPNRALFNLLAKSAILINGLGAIVKSMQ